MARCRVVTFSEVVVKGVLLDGCVWCGVVVVIRVVGVLPWGGR